MRAGSLALLVAAALVLGACTSSAGPDASSIPGPSWQPSHAPAPTDASPIPEPSPSGGTEVEGLDPADWVGIWQGVEPDVVGTSNVETVLQPNGKFTSQATNAQAGTLVTMWGDWEIHTSDRPMLRFTITGHEPTEFCGPLGCTPVLAPAGVSNYFRFVDRNTVVLAGPGCTDSSCEVTYWRVG